eukprot:CAMPEP_0174925870 /NCGR_PEP_ID=MMETSP1355-20121228/8199_1 /TAXON_ID=464990 /ORGANISM="Hemiselmis tepida, Strain CCMP443" /LENGTH=282 /DNA_ID=CAMNT_0016171833 /DNA_START=238 /DNA_END=1083 /DNA_ORIENTATION=-
MRFTGSALARAAAPSCPLRSTDEIATPSSFRRRGDALPTPYIPELKAEQAVTNNSLSISCDEARSQASTTATSSPSMDPTVPMAGACGGAVSPTVSGRGQCENNSNIAPGGALSATHGLSMDGGLLAHGFPQPKKSPVLASWQSMIPASAAAVPCDHAGLPVYEEMTPYMRLDGEAGGAVGESDGMDLDGGWAEADPAMGSSPPRQEVLWPVRQLHKGFPDPGDGALRAAQEHDHSPLTAEEDPFLRRPTHRGYPDPAERERFEQHVGEQFLKHGNCTKDSP